MTGSPSETRYEIGSRRQGDVLLRRVALFGTWACTAMAIGTLAGILVPA